VGNLLCGFLALHYVFQGSYTSAAWLVFLGAVLDKMDGKIARAMGRDSFFGIQFDSIVDVCTFGFAPAALIYQAYLGSGWGLALAFVFLLCGAVRLARFNTLSLNDEKSDDYLGLPIPTAAICLTQFAVFEGSWQSAHVVPAVTMLVLFLAFLMVSRLDYYSMPNFRGTSFADRFGQLFFVVSISLIIYNEMFFFPMSLIYVSSGIYRWAVSLFSDEITQHT
jgi:CDP-diacylglycerol--serine O-phosphatidyltransferase